MLSSFGIFYNRVLKYIILKYRASVQTNEVSAIGAIYILLFFIFLNITATYIAAKGDPIANLQEDLAAEQKARATYEKLIDLCRDNPDVLDPLKFLRQREIVHFQRFGETLRGIQDRLATRKMYMNK